MGVPTIFRQAMTSHDKPKSLQIIPRCTLPKGSSVLWRCTRATAAETKGGNLSKWGKRREMKAGPCRINITCSSAESG